MAQRELTGQQEMLDRIVGQLDVAPDGIVDAMDNQRRENEALQAANLGLLARVRTLQQDNAAAKIRQTALDGDIMRLQLTVDQLKQENADQKDDIAALQETIRNANGEPGAAIGWRARLWNWRWYLGIGLLVLGIAVAAATYWTTTGTEDEVALDENGDPNPDQ